MKSLLARSIVSVALLSLSSVAWPAQSDVAAKVDDLFAEFSKPDSPGCAVGVVQDGNLVLARGYGSANLEHRIANGPSLVYDIGSISKQFTAFSVLLLAQEGKLSLDDDVRKYLPALPRSEPITTLRHLIHHTSGLRDYPSLLALAGVPYENLVTERDTLELVLRQKGINFPPGSEFRYSNTGYFLLSLIVREASGKSLSQFARERIFAPLGMTHTLIAGDHRRIVPQRATGYWPTDDGTFDIEMSNFEATGDGAVLTSVADLARWDRNFHQPIVGNTALIEQLQTVGKLSDGTALDYAAGLDIGTHRGMRIVSHSGGWAGYRSDLLRFPDQRFSVVCLCNLGTVDARSFTLRVADLYLGGTAFHEPDGRSPRRVPSASPASIERNGFYRSAASGEVYRLAAEEHGLRLNRIADSQGRLFEPVGDGRYASEHDSGHVLDFSDTASSAVVHLVRRSHPPERLERVPVFAPASAQIAEFAGRYYSEELDATYELLATDQQLHFAAPDRVRRPLSPTIRDSFIGTEGQHFQFDRAADGAISGFSLSFGRIANLRFAKRR